MRNFLSSPKNLFHLSWPFLAVIIAHTIWGGNFVVAKLTLQEVPPMSLAFIRFTLATLLLLPFLLVEKEKPKINKRDLPQLFTVGLLMATFNISLFYFGIAKTRAIDASVLTMSVPILSLVFSWIFLKEKIYSINLVGILTGLVGAIITIGLPLSLVGLGFNPQAFLGNLLIIAGSICWVVGAMFSKSLHKKYSTLYITAFIFVVGMLSFSVPALTEYLQNPSWITKLTPVGIIGVLYITLFSSIVAFFTFEWGLGKLGVVKADLLQYIEPPVASLLAILILNERADPSFLFGLILVIIGVYWGTLGRESHKHAKYHRT